MYHYYFQKKIIINNLYFCFTIIDYLFISILMNLYTFLYLFIGATIVNNRNVFFHNVEMINMGQKLFYFIIHHVLIYNLGSE